MPDLKISAAADPGPLVATDKVPMARSASTTAYSATMAELAAFANTAYVPNYYSGAPNMDGTAAPGTAAFVSRGDHVHPSDTSRAPLASPTFTGTPSLPTGTIAVTQTSGDSSTKLATTSFVTAAVAGATGGGPFLPIAGGTLTGALNGTSATFSGGGSFGASSIFAGNTNFFKNLTGTITVLALQNAGGTTQGQIYYDTSTNNMFFQNITGAGGQIYIDGSGNLNASGATAYKPGGGSWTAPSDARIKDVLGEYLSGLDEVIRLRPVRYVYKGNDTRTEGESSPHARSAEERAEFVGLVAQEAETVMPEMVGQRAGFVDGVAVDDLRDIDATSLIYALVNAVRELAIRVATLEELAPG